MLLFSLEVYCIMIVSIKSVNTKALSTVTGDFKPMAAKFVPDALAEKIADLVYKSTTEQAEREYTEETYDNQHDYQETEYAQIQDKTKSNGDPEKTMRITLDELVEKVKERIIDDLDQERIKPKISTRENNEAIPNEEYQDSEADNENDSLEVNTDDNPRQMRGNFRLKPNERLPVQGQNRLKGPASNGRITEKQSKVQRNSDAEGDDYPEPESVPAPKLKRIRPKSDLYETIKIKSKKNKDSYEDYVIPPKEYDMFATEEEDKNRQQKKRQPELQGQAQFIGEYLGDEAGEVPKIKEPQNKRIKNINRPKVKQNIAPVRPMKNNSNKKINYNNRPRQKFTTQDYEDKSMKNNKQGIKQQNYGDYDTPVKKEKIPPRKRPIYAEYDQPTKQQSAPVKKVKTNYDDDKPVKHKGQDYAESDRPTKGNKAVKKGADNFEYSEPQRQGKGNQQPDYNEENEKNVPKVKMGPPGHSRETTEYIEPTEVYVDDNTQSTTEIVLKLRTENIGDTSDEEANYGGPSTLKQKKGTDIPTREVYKMSSPDYYNKQPKVVEKYDFAEPIPEKDREPENTKSWLGPPAKINGKVKVAG